MPELIYKLQPNRTIQLRGFDDLGASAAVHAATSSSFKVSGIFRDPADFAVLVLYDADNFYEHPRLKYLPDTNFDGLTLAFDVTYSGLMPLDSPKFPTIDWPYLDAIRPDSTTARIRLFDHAVQTGGTYTAAAGQFVIQDNGFHEYDRLTLWYQNIAFDYIAPKVTCSYSFFAAGAGTVHSVTAAGSTYSYTEAADRSSAQVASAVASAAGASAYVTATPFTNTVTLRSKNTDGGSFAVSSSADGFTYTLYSVGAATIARNQAEVGLLIMLILAPMLLLSGIWTPPEAMPEMLRYLMAISPLYYFIDISYGIFLKGSGLDILWEPIVGMAVIGSINFSLGMWRFRKQFQ